MKSKTEIENTIAELLKMRQRGYKLRHDIKAAQAQGDNHEWLAFSLDDVSKNIRVINAEIRELRNELRVL